VPKKPIIQIISTSPSRSNIIITCIAAATINNTEYDLGMKFNSGYAKPEIKSNSGQVVYIDNRRSISRANDQVEDIKIVIEF